MEIRRERIRLVLICSIVFFLCTSVFLLSWAIFDVDEEQKVLEDKYDTNINVNEFRFEKDVLIVFGVTICSVFLFGLIAVFVKSTCMLLFYSTTGCGMFILLLLILYVESVVSRTSLSLLILGNLASAGLAAYYAFYDDDEIDYKRMEKPDTINLL